MSRGICRDRSDIFHLRKNGASSARTITDKSVGYHVPLSNFEDDPPIPCGSLVFVSFMCFLDRSLSWTSVISHPFFFIILFVVLDTFVARTFQMAFNRRSEPSRETMAVGASWKKKMDGEADALSLGITSIKTPPQGEDSSSILPKSDRWQERLLLRLSTYKRYKRGYSYFPSPRSAVYTGRGGGEREEWSLVSPSFHRANIFLVGQLYITGRAR